MTKYFAPVFIPTLCRFEHLKRCLLSLEKNSLAKETIVYIALDYPLKNEHWVGYEKIKEFLNQKFAFKELIIIKREKNFGALINHEVAMEELYKQYDAIITSEDDNEFSPNFLEYMNACLEKYESDRSVIAIGGYSFPIKWITKDNNIVRHCPFCTAWGMGVWKNRNEWMNVNSVQLFERIKHIKEAFKLFVRSPRIFVFSLQIIWKRETLKYDIGWSCYMLLFEKYMIYPVISKTRNWGWDGSGINCKKNDRISKHELDKVTHFEIKGNDSVFMKENEILMNDLFKVSKASVLKTIIKYLLIKLKFRKL